MAITMVAPSCLYPNPNATTFLYRQLDRKIRPFPRVRPRTQTRITAAVKYPTALTDLHGADSAFVPVGPALDTNSPFLQLNEPSNALSLFTWAIHVCCVVEWIVAMALVWQYGELSGYKSWKGLSWGMVPLLGVSFCACTWHFFYNSQSLEVLVALQAALTIIGNTTMCVAAFRICREVEKSSKIL